MMMWPLGSRETPAAARLRPSHVGTATDSNEDYPLLAGD